MKRLKFVLPSILLLLLAGWRSQIDTRYEITEGSSLWVEGTSTLHDWRCDATDMTGTFVANGEDQITDIVSASFSVASALECKNGTMNKKAHEALDAEDHPSISFEMTRSDIEAGEAGSFTIQTTGQLTIAGETRETNALVNATRNEVGQMVLSGALSVKMSEFGMNPPKAMLGAIKTGDEVTVHFQFVSDKASNL